MKEQQCNTENSRRRRKKKEAKDACAAAICEQYSVAKNCSVGIMKATDGPLLMQEDEMEKIESMANQGIKDECAIL